LKNKKDLLALFLSFLKISCFTIGGGYAMIPLIENEFVQRRKWLDEDEFMNLTVIAESTPGPIAINCATYTGYKRAGFIGSVVSTFGMVLPSFVIIYIISMFFTNLLEIRFINSAFRGIAVAVGVVVIAAGWKMVKKIFKKKKTPKERLTPAIVMVLCFGITLLGQFTKLHISTVWLILLTACVGVILFFSKKRGKAGGKQ